ncbi:hypothetical protein P3T21_000085 [Paraburkholderia sp. GAS334]
MSARPVLRTAVVSLLVAIRDNLINASKELTSASAMSIAQSDSLLIVQEATRVSNELLDTRCGVFAYP